MVKQYHGVFAEYSKVVQEMDSTYGGPTYNNKKQIKGRKILFQIFKYLSTHRSSTCEEIAQHEIQNSPKSKRKIKSVTDDIRKFILNNLLPRKLVKEDGTKKKYNKEIQTYSLDHNGALYAIHLLSKNRPHEKFHDVIIYDESIIQNLAVEYPEYLPFVFDRLNVFKKVLGDHWLDYLKIHEIVDMGLDSIVTNRYGALNPDDLLNSFIGRSAFVFLTSESISENFASLDAFYNHKKYPGPWTNLQHHKLKVNDPWGIGITLLVYNNTLSSLWDEIQRASFTDGDSILIRVTALSKCQEIFGDVPELWKWYKMFVKSVNTNTKNNLKKISDFEHLIRISRLSKTTR